MASSNDDRPLSLCESQRRKNEMKYAFLYLRMFGQDSIKMQRIMSVEISHHSLLIDTKISAKANNRYRSFNASLSIRVISV
jgi:hypothetical protein